MSRAQNQLIVDPLTDIKELQVRIRQIQYLRASKDQKINQKL